jgi:hypothetical protein
MYLLVLILFVVYADELVSGTVIGGVPAALFGLAAVCAFFLLGLWLLHRLRIRQAKDRADFDAVIHFTQDDGGLRFATPSIEYYLKWRGITQLLLEPDGVVISHGNLFYLVPYAAFASTEDGFAFVRDVYGRLSEKAKTISQKHVRVALAAAGRNS